jgi:hypothetical protein
MPSAQFMSNPWRTHVGHVHSLLGYATSLRLDGTNGSRSAAVGRPTGEDRLIGAGGQIPQPHRAVPVSGGHPTPIWAERHRAHWAGVTGERALSVP